MSLIDLILSSIVINICFLYVGSMLLNKKINFKKGNVIIAIILSLIFSPIIYLSFETFFKILMNYLLIICLYKLVFDENIQKIFILSFATVALYFISEILVSGILIIYSKTALVPIEKDIIGGYIINIVISLFVFIFVEMKFTRNIICKMIGLFEKTKSQTIILILVLIIGILGRNNLSFLNFDSTYIINLITIVLFGVIIFFLYKEKETSNKLSQKYDQLLNYIQKYEIEITKKNMTIHEFKNQIIAIKTLASKSNRKLNEYINSLMNDIKTGNENNLKGMGYIPPGGLKGLIYFKLGDLEEKGISVKTRIASKIKKTAFCKNNTNLYMNILKIIGVYLDNAVEACVQSRKKKIYLEIYCQDNASHFVLSNTYKGPIDINNFDKIGYSTKGKGRGYGFRLVSNIIDSHNNIKQFRELNDDYYTVHLVVKQQ